MTKITESHRDAFEALMSGQFGNFALVSCFVDGQPAAAIATVNEEQGIFTITPLFVSITPEMTLTDHDGSPAAVP